MLKTLPARLVFVCVFPCCSCLSMLLILEGSKVEYLPSIEATYRY